MPYNKTDKLIKYNNQYNKDNYDRISLMLPKGSKKILSELTKERGEKMNTLIRRAIDRELDRLGAEPLPDSKK